MSDVAPVPAAPPPSEDPMPTTADQPDLDRLVRGLDDLTSRPVGRHHDRLAEVHEALHAALHSGLPEQPSAS